MDPELCILTWNIHKGFSMSGRRFVLHVMREALAETRADVVFLQEAQGRNDRHARRHADWPERPQFEVLADTVWPHHAYGRNAIYDHGHHGNAILSRRPFVASENIDVSPWPFAASRSLLHGVTALPGHRGSLHVVCVHFGFVGLERRPQIRRLCAHLREHVPDDEPLVIAGDFNDWSGRAERDFEAGLGLVEVFRTLYGRHARTWPAIAPVLPLDRIYVRGLTPRAAERLDQAPWRRLSDHAPLRARLRP